MSPSSCCFSFDTSSAMPLLSIVAFCHDGSPSEPDTTYLGRLFSRSACPAAAKSGTATQGNWPAAGRPVRVPAGYQLGRKREGGREEGDHAYPDALLAGADGLPPGPEARYEQAESISLAFVAALQVLPPRQLAVLILRDVLGFRAAEVSGMLGSTVESVNSALKRARASMQHRQPAGDGPPAPGSAAENALVGKFTSAYQSADIDAVVALLTDDVFMSMPPTPYEYEGRDLVGRFLGRLFAAGRIVDLVPTRANGQPAFGAYLSTPSGARPATGLITISLAGRRICATSRFESSVLPWFGLPLSLPGR
jgi:hypothetical protein